MESSVQVLVPTDPAPKPKNPWGTAFHATPTPCSLASVMDEELAHKLQTEENDRVGVFEGCGLDHVGSLAPPTESQDTGDDQLLARMLQLEFDREHDLLLHAEEKQYNRDSKVRLSFEKYRSLPPSFLEDEEEGEEDWPEGGGEKVTEQSTGSHSRGRRRSKGVPAGVPTKHDPVLCGRRNARNMERLPPAFPCGDMSDETEDFRLPNAVYNVLKEHSHREEKHAQRLHEKKEHSTQEHVFDPKTRLLVFKFVDSGLLAEVNGCISTGKEASVYHATGGSSEDFDVPAECALKVFKTTLNEFKSRDRYIKDDYRFKDRFSKQNPRKFVRLWAEKEKHNLKRLHEGGIMCPRVVTLRKHILIMEFIGEDQKPAPKLKDLTGGQLGRDQMNSAYQQCIQAMQRMFSVCHLVHSDLSEYNMLWHRNQVVFIDVSQSVEPSHPHGLEFLLRDCTNVSEFFSRCGVHDVLSPHRLFNYVSGMDVQAETRDTFLAQLRTHSQKEKLLQMTYSRQAPYPFDFFFERSPQQQQQQQQVEEEEEEEEEEGDTASSGSDSGATLH